MTFVNGSVSLAVLIQIDGVAVATAYAANAIMNNPAATFGILRFTAYDSAGAVAISNGVPIQDVYCYRDATNAGKGVAVIAYGFQAADTFEIVPVFGVHTAGGALDWRELERITVKVYPLTSANGIALTPNVTI